VKYRVSMSSAASVHGAASCTMPIAPCTYYGAPAPQPSIHLHVIIIDPGAASGLRRILNMTLHRCEELVRAKIPIAPGRSRLN